MNIQYNLLQKSLIDEINSTEYIYENNETKIILDINIPKNKEVEVLSKVANWFSSPSHERAEDLFPGGYFIVIYNKKDHSFFIIRDRCGIKSGYYLLTKNTLLISNHVHWIAGKQNFEHLNPMSGEMILSLEFLFDGLTIYKDIKEVEMGSTIKLKSNGSIMSHDRHPIVLAENDNELNLNENAKQLRDLTNRIHKKLSGSDNLVYLSGGIDSCVMLAALDDVCRKDSIRNVSFRVKGTLDDETFYAKKMAYYLGLPCEIKEIDPQQRMTREMFEEAVIGMNNPYPGYWIFSAESSVNTVCFAGQDTRLHTPDIHPIDKLVLDLLIKKINVNDKRTFIYDIVNSLSKKYGWNDSKNKILKNFSRLAAISSPKVYLNKYIFKLKHLDEGFRIKYRKEIYDFFNLDLSKIKNKRYLYNEIIKVKWKQQYTDDMRYLQDLGRLAGTYITVPFYDYSLAQFSSSIPFKYATRFTRGRDRFTDNQVKVNKLVLREAYKDKLDETVLYRKKAVSPTMHLFFNGSLGKIVTSILREDINSKKSFIKENHYTLFTQRYLSKNSQWKVYDQDFLTRIYYLATMCVYYKMELPFFKGGK